MSVSESTEVLVLRVSGTDMLTADVREVRLRPATEGSRLPAFEPGAHISLEVRLHDGSAGWREYSLVALHAGEFAHPAEYRIAVRKELPGRGGSQFVHDFLKVGDTINVRAPRNQFPMEEGGSRAVLIAGGIGVTPILSMAQYCRSRDRPVSVYYAGRSRDSMAYINELSRLLAGDLHLHADDEAGCTLDPVSLFRQFSSTDNIYFCGPTPMIDAILSTAEKSFWPRDQLHFELFNAPAAAAEDHAFEVELAQSGKTLAVPAEKSILDVLIEEGLDPLYDCKRGECGVCAATVLSGDIDHRDYILTKEEMEAGNIIHTCVSRCKGPKLVLDI